MHLLLCYSLEEFWYNFSCINGKFICWAQMRRFKSLSITQLCIGESLFFNMLWNFVSKSLPLQASENKLVFRFSNRRKHVVLCWKNDGRNPTLFHLFYLFFHDPFESVAKQWEQQHLLHLHFFCRWVKVDESEFSQSRSAKLWQRPSIEEDEQQPLSVHLWAKKHMEKFLTEFYKQINYDWSLSR